MRNEISEGKEGSVKIDKRLEDIVLGMFERCFKDKQFKQALGIAIEARRLDKIEESIVKSDNILGMIHYAQTVCLPAILNREYRQIVIFFFLLSPLF